MHGSELQAVCVEVPVEQCDERRRLRRGKIVDALHEHEIVAIGGEQHGIGCDHVVVACIEVPAECCERRNRRLRRRSERVEQRCRDAVAVRVRRCKVREHGKRRRRVERGLRLRQQAWRDENQMHDMR